MGLRHGLFCLGSCWALMLLMFAAGGVNLVWMLALGLLMTAERMSRQGVHLARLAGILLVVWSAALCKPFNSEHRVLRSNLAQTRRWAHPCRPEYAVARPAPPADSASRSAGAGRRRLPPGGHLRFCHAAAGHLPPAAATLRTQFASSPSIETRYRSPSMVTIASGKLIVLPDCLPATSSVTI